MIGIDQIVWIVVYLLIAAVILGLVWWLIGYIESQWTGGPPLVFKGIRIVFVVLVVLLIIGILLNLAGYPVVRLRN